jgi:hypothetical protein
MPSNSKVFGALGVGFEGGPDFGGVHGYFLCVLLWLKWWKSVDSKGLARSQNGKNRYIGHLHRTSKNTAISGC